MFGSLGNLVTDPSELGKGACRCLTSALRTTGARGVTDSRMSPSGADARRALVLHDRPPVLDLIERTLNHGLFVVKAAHNLPEADVILARWKPHLVLVDMDHVDFTALLHRLDAANTLTRSFTPALGLTPRGDLATRLRAFGLGVDDILAMPFCPMS